ncbi:hypothetical protein [Corynebacterium ureicelerivorans]|nr:hypothetical protein [Corynebacterium ureicelerivorans]
MQEDELHGAQVIVEDMAGARRLMFKTIDMPWEDLAVARVVARQV